MGESRSDQIVGHLAVQHPVAGVGFRHHVGEQILEFEHLDAAVDHLGDEVEVVAAGLLQPDDVVEQQLVAVLRGEPLMGQAGRADHDPAQPARLRPDAQPGIGARSQDGQVAGGHQRDGHDRRQRHDRDDDPFGFGEGGQAAFPAGPQVERGAGEVEHRRDQQVLPAARVDQPHRVRRARPRR